MTTSVNPIAASKTGLHCLYCSLVVLERTGDHRDLCCLCCLFVVVERAGDHRNLWCLYCPFGVVERTGDHRDMCCLYCPFVVVERTGDHKDLPAYQGTLTLLLKIVTGHAQCTLLHHMLSAHREQR